jgi:choline dehydrogenase
VTFDYIIVGAGTAGCVLASRLSADARARVLLLEAGGPDTRAEIRIPAAFYKLFRTDCDWAYETESQPHLNNRRLYWPRGKVLGGSSSINAMIYIRGHSSDYDHWAALGNPGWSFHEVLPFFLRAENQQRGASDFHATGGPLWVSDLRTVNPLSRAFVEAGVELGYPHNPDFNGAQQDGVGFYQCTQRHGARHSAADAYLKSALGRKNLAVLTRAQATRILFERTRAVGVEFSRDGKTETAQAGSEILLCGGAVNSPQLLLLSGVGPAAQLRALGIEVVADVPGVGENLHDHICAPVVYRSTQPVTLDHAETPVNFLRFKVFRRGPFTSIVAEAGGFLRIEPQAPAPDLQFVFGPCFYLDHGFTRPEGHGFSFGPTLLRPRSRGRITLRSADPFALPAIQPNYFAEQYDLRMMVAGVRLARRLAAARAFAPYRGEEFLPGDAADTDEALADYLRRKAETLYHPVGTCKMGPARDPLAVVDCALRVRGTEGLRVADASIMPAIIGGNTNAPTFMIAEKAAALIRA